MALLLTIVYYLLTAYYYIMIAYILMGWIPELRQSRVYASLKQLTDPYLRLFRGFIVIGMMDFTPILGFILYNFGLNLFRQAIPIILSSF